MDIFFFFGCQKKLKRWLRNWEWKESENKTEPKFIEMTEEYKINNNNESESEEDKAIKIFIE